VIKTKPRSLPHFILKSKGDYLLLSHRPISLFQWFRPNYRRETKVEVGFPHQIHLLPMVALIILETPRPCFLPQFLLPPFLLLPFLLPPCPHHLQSRRSLLTLELPPLTLLPCHRDHPCVPRVSLIEWVHLPVSLSLTQDHQHLLYNLLRHHRLHLLVAVVRRHPCQEGQLLEEALLLLVSQGLVHL